MISAELTRCTDSGDDLLESPVPPEDRSGGAGIPAGDTGAPWDLGGAGGGEELDGAGEEELAVGGEDESGDGGDEAEGGGLLLFDGGD
jgi:hypothetical protein